MPAPREEGRVQLAFWVDAKLAHRFRTFCETVKTDEGRRRYQRDAAEEALELYLSVFARAHRPEAVIESPSSILPAAAPGGELDYSGGGK
jgi:hypothetical protein